MTLTTKNLVIFDNDGVLIDSEKLAARSNADLLTRLGYPMTAEECEQRFCGVSDRSMQQMLIDDGCDLPADFIQQMYDVSKELFETELEPIAGVKDVVRQVQTRGQVAVASNAPRANLLKNLRTTGYDTILPPALCFSGTEVANPKPAPDLHHHILDRFDRPAASSIVVEDSPVGARGAKAAGIDFIAVLYAVAPHMRDQRIQAFRDLGARAILETPEELGENLERYLS